MPAKSTPSKSRRIAKWLLWSFVAILFTLILLLVALLLVPSIVSTQWSKEQLEDQAFQVIHRPVRIGALNWTWDRGILLKGLEISDDPLFSLKPMGYLPSR